MKLKVLSLECDELIRNTNEETELDWRIKDSKSFDNNVFVYSILIKTSGKSIGARNKNSGKFEGLEEVMLDTGHELFKCRFIVIDTIHHNVYYDGNMKDVKTLLKDFFDIESSQISHIVDRDSLTAIKSIRISEVSGGQVFAEDQISTENQMIDEIFDTGRIEKRTYELVFADEGSLFNRDQFNRLLDEERSSRTTVRVKGFDEEGNQVVLASQIAREVNFLPDIVSWSDKINLSLDIIYRELGEVVMLR